VQSHVAKFWTSLGTFFQSFKIKPYSISIGESALKQTQWCQNHQDWMIIDRYMADFVSHQIHFVSHQIHPLESAEGF